MVLVKLVINASDNWLKEHIHDVRRVMSHHKDLYRLGLINRFFPHRKHLSLQSHFIQCVSPLQQSIMGNAYPRRLRCSRWAVNRKGADFSQPPPHGLLSPSPSSSPVRLRQHPSSSRKSNIGSHHVFTCHLYYLSWIGNLYNDDSINGAKCYLF